MSEQLFNIVSNVKLITSVHVVYNSIWKLTFINWCIRAKMFKINHRAHIFIEILITVVIQNVK